MDNTQIKQILLEQRAEITELFRQNIIERECFSTAIKDLEGGLAKVVMGVRRGGKSILAHQMLKNLPYGYINFDDERLTTVKAEDLNKFFEAAKEIEPHFKYLLLDEIQNTLGWELFVNRLLRNGYNIVVTGSNSKLLSRELATHLTGRHLSLELFPFSFKEFLTLHNITLHENDRYITEKRAQIKAMLERYIREGGFPEAQRLELKENYLRGLFDKIITKDIIMRYNIKYSRALKEMSIYLLSNFASRATYHKVKNIFDVKSVHTVKNYTHYFEEAYLIFELNAFSFKQKDLIKQPRKIYGIDTGLINAIAPKTSINAGRLMENAVFLQLKRLGREIYYYSDGNLEVDFLIKDGLKIDQLIQVCYSLDNIETKDRELRSLAKASKELGCENAVVLTWDTSGEETVKDVKIRMVPLWQWLCWG